MKVMLLPSLHGSAILPGHVTSAAYLIHFTAEEYDKWNSFPCVAKGTTSFSGEQFFSFVLDALPESTRIRLLQESLQRAINPHQNAP